MTFLIDPIESHPPHAFALSEIKAFMRLVPAELKRDVNLVRLHNGNRHTAAHWIAIFSRLEERLVIASRGINRDRVMEAIIRELARRNLPESDAWRLQLPQSVIETHTRRIFAAVKPQVTAPLQWNRIKLCYVKPHLADTQ